MKNSADQGGWYPQRPKAEVDNTLHDLQNSSYPTKVEFNNCFIVHSKYFLSFAVTLFVFPLTKYNTTLSPGFLGQRFNNLRRAAILTSFWRHWFNNFRWTPHWFNMAKILSRFGEQQLVMVNYACGFNQSDTGKYFEWIIISNIASSENTDAIFTPLPLLPPPR